MNNSELKLKKVDDLSEIIRKNVNDWAHDNQSPDCLQVILSSLSGVIIDSIISSIEDHNKRLSHARAVTSYILDAITEFNNKSNHKDSND